MATIKSITANNATEGSTGKFTITLDSPAPAGGLLVNYNFNNSIAALGTDYTVSAGTSLSNLTANSFVISAGATSANLTIQAKTDTLTEGTEPVTLNASVAQGGAVDFAPAVTYAMGGGTFSVALADVNADGKPDVITSNDYVNNVSVRLGNGDGTFGSKTNFAAGNNPYSLVVADANDDGKLDVLTANYTSNDVSLLLGSGNGSFAAQRTFKVGDAYFGIAVGDVNNDSRLDVLTANFYGNTVSLLLGNGNGSFAAQKTLAVGIFPSGITVGDINADGNLDIVTSNERSGDISLLLGNGNGGFAAQQTFKIDAGWGDVALADINGDGWLDALAANGHRGTLSLLLNDGNGSFKAQQTFTVGSNAGIWLYVTAADVNGDGKLDALVTNPQQDTVSLLINNGNGGFKSQQTLAVGDHPMGVAVADLSGDGKPDVVTANEDSSNISVLLNTTAMSNATAVSQTLNISDAIINNVGSVAIAGTAAQNQTLTATVSDADGFSTVNYQWLANNVPVSGATSSSYTLTGSEVGKTISVTANYTDNLGFQENPSSLATDTVVAAVNPAVNITGSDLITGENGDTVVFKVSLATQPFRDVSISFSSSDTTEGVVSKPSLTFTTSNWNIPQTLKVIGQNDTLNDQTVSYQLNGTISTNDVNYYRVNINPVILNNQDDGLDGQVVLSGDKNGIPTADTLQGQFGNDKLYGLLLPDDLSGGAGNDSLYGGYDDDFLYGEDGNDELFGEQDNDKLYGGAGNDVLYGTGGGLDTLVGGAGNDTYYLDFDNNQDVIDDQGLATDVDIVIMPYQITSYTLPNGIENGTIDKGTQAADLSGNNGNNSLTGNDGTNVLSGAVGRDSLFGGLGNDVLIGGADNDTLSGGAGKDIFKILDKTSVDKVTDFKPIDDTVQLDNAVFSKLGANGVLTNSMFKIGAATDSNDYLIYNKTTGALSYDADGNGAGAAVQIAILGVNLTLTNADFVVI